MSSCQEFGFKLRTWQLRDKKEGFSLESILEIISQIMCNINLEVKLYEVNIFIINIVMRINLKNTILIYKSLEQNCNNVDLTPQSRDGSQK